MSAAGPGVFGLHLLVVLHVGPGDEEYSGGAEEEGGAHREFRSLGVKGVGVVSVWDEGRKEGWREGVETYFWS